MKVLFRVDGSDRIGTGHVMRCLVLAEELRRRGANVAFASRRLPGSIIDRIDEQRFEVRVLDSRDGSSPDEAIDARETLAIVDGLSPDWVVVDSYDLGRDWERLVMASGVRLMAVDDLEREHECDILLDQNWDGARTADRYAGRVPDRATRLLGPAYALVHSDFAQLRGTRRRQGGSIERVMVFFGGSDATNETARVLEAISLPRHRHLELDLVLGPNHPDPVAIHRAAGVRGRTRVFAKLPSLATLMRDADFAFGAGGTATWERICLDLPSAVTVLAENQRTSAEALAESGYIRLLGVAGEVTAADYAGALDAPIPQPGALPVLVDGSGAGRCADAMSRVADGGGRAAADSAHGPYLSVRHPGELASAAVLIRPLEESDAALVVRWRNDPFIAGQMLLPPPRTVDDQLAWFNGSYARGIGNRREWIIELNGTPVGTTSLHGITDEEAEFGILIGEADARGTGAALAASFLTLEEGRALGLQRVWLRVRAGNLRAMKLYARLGFHEVGVSDETVQMSIDLARLADA